MSRIRSLELLFHLEKKNLKSNVDCLVAAIHCLLINENLMCVGIGTTWPEPFKGSELLPANWNKNQSQYSLRYASKDLKSLILIKVYLMEYTIQVDAILNDDLVGVMSLTVEDYVTDDYTEYNTAYKDLKGLIEAFSLEIKQALSSPPLSVATPGFVGGLDPPEQPRKDSLEKTFKPFKPPEYPRFPKSKDATADNSKTGDGSKKIPSKYQLTKDPS